MFEALLESSTRREGVLRRIHYLLSILIGTIAFAQGTSLLPSLLLQPGTRELVVTSAVAGALATACALMLCYVWTDTRQQHLHPWPWFMATLFLNLPGFLAYLVYSARKTGDWKRASIPLAYVGESVFVGVLMLIPLIYTQALPRYLLISELHIPPPLGRPAAQPAGPRSKPVPHPAAHEIMAPASIPPSIVHVVDPPEPMPPSIDSGLTGPYVVGALPGGGQSDGILTGVIGSAGWGGPPPPPTSTHVATRVQRVKRGGDVVAAQALYQPRPVYPPLAIMARIQGTVVLQAVIGTNGTVQELKVFSGHPLLVPAALAAVKAWRYQPTLLDGEPVEVLTEINVNFRLDE